MHCHNIIYRRYNEVFFCLFSPSSTLPAFLTAYAKIQLLDVYKRQCLTFGIPDYFFDKYIYPEIPGRDKLIAMLMDYVHSIRKRFTEHPVRFIFSEDGLQRFLETGRIPEYPPAVYRPFELSDRIVLIRQFLKFCPPNGLCMLKCTIGDLDNELFMYCLLYTSRCV